jgi:hypothetical protein
MMEFDKWFTAQFGKRPSKKELSNLESEIEVSQWKYQNAAKLFYDVHAWEEKRKAALYAWNARTGGGANGKE